jgi:hypothetical protein
MAEQRFFLSHASGDRAVVSEIRDDLERAGLLCWMAPRDIVPGQHYGRALVDAIAGCAGVILFLSREANLSAFVQAELGQATAAGKPIMVVRLEPIALAPDFGHVATSWPAFDHRPDRPPSALAAEIDRVLKPSWPRKAVVLARGRPWLAAAILVGALGAGLALWRQSPGSTADTGFSQAPSVEVFGSLTYRASVLEPKATVVDGIRSDVPMNIFAREMTLDILEADQARLQLLAHMPRSDFADRFERSGSIPFVIPRLPMRVVTCLTYRPDIDAGPVRTVEALDFTEGPSVAAAFSVTRAKAPRSFSASQAAGCEEAARQYLSTEAAGGSERS